MAKDYQYYFSQLRKIEDHREEQAVKEIRKIYRDILKETQHFIADEYAALAEDGVLTYDILRAKSQDARFLQELEQRLGDLSIDVSKQIKKSTEEMYQLSFDGIREAAAKSKDLEEFRELLGGMDMTKAQQMWNTVDNTIMDIALEKNHKNIVWDIKREIATALTVGDRYDTMADRLAKSLDGNYKKATLIARTEVHRVREAAHSASAKELNETLKKGNSGLRYVKKWKTMKDGAVRPQSRYKTKKGWKTGRIRPGAPNHMKMHNVVVLEEEDFDLGGGVKADAPGQSGVAGHDCNCRCQCLHLLMDDQEFFEATGRHFPVTQKELENSEKDDKIEVQGTVNSGIVEGRNLQGEIDYTNSQFQHDIQTAVHAQGFDGVPQVVEYEEFKEAMEKSNFYAERTYGAPDQKTLDEWQKQLYEGEWYIDCSTGGAQYGQGMYCAASYDLKDNKAIGGIGWEMSHYQSLAIQRGNTCYTTEAITLQPNARILVLPNGEKADEYISDVYRLEYLRKYASGDAQKKAVEDYIKACQAVEEGYRSLSGDFDKIGALYDARDEAAEKVGKELLKASADALKYYPSGSKYGKMKNAGTLAVEMGYDAINAEGHGQSGSYTVVLNRTKVIFCKGGSLYGN